MKTLGNVNARLDAYQLVLFLKRKFSLIFYLVSENILKCIQCKQFHLKVTISLEVPFQFKFQMCVTIFNFISVKRSEMQ